MQTTLNPRITGLCDGTVASRKAIAGLATYAADRARRVVAVQEAIAEGRAYLDTANGHRHLAWYDDATGDMGTTRPCSFLRRYTLSDIRIA